ncbi:MAG: phosphate ABC transporter substrate-binding protein [Theionarchaea archaeon]|nr:phosphate ABC transporter substrate-binding protein [Theionarchaea archaeon]MBU7038483.1 phosphate ABC transporter substrate-binding protein [Theionarchaea archaeon]
MTKKNAALLAAVGLIMIIGAYTGGLIGNGRTAEIQTLSVRGSTTVLPIVQLAAEKYMDLHANVNIQISGGGSSVGAKSAGEGTVDIGMASRELKETERSEYPTLNPIAIARDGIALIVHPSSSVSTLTVEEVKGIYDGTYTSWSELGGEDVRIVVVGRDSASGTREFFWEYIMKKEDFVQGMLEKNSNGAVKQTISQTPGAIGYVGLGYIDSTVKALNIRVGNQEVEPTTENVKSGLYPISRSLYILVDGEPEGLARDFIDFILSDEGQSIVEEEGFVPV